MWIVTAMWRVIDPAGQTFNLDTENLLTVEGPGCWICEEHWTPELAAKPCPGEPTLIYLDRGDSRA